MDLPLTPWSLIGRVSHPEPDARRAAIGELLERYLPALRSHLLHARHVDPARIDDLLQSFIADLVMDKDVLARADRTRGRFRNFILTVLDRYAANYLAFQNARKRSPRCLLSINDDDLADSRIPAHRGCPDPYVVAWAREIIRNALSLMRQDCLDAGRQDIWNTFESRLLTPILGGTPAASYEALAHQNHLPSGKHAANLLVTAKRRFHHAICRVIGQYLRSDAEIEAEIDDLFRALSQGA